MSASELRRVFLRTNRRNSLPLILPYAPGGVPSNGEAAEPVLGPTFGRTRGLPSHLADIANRDRASRRSPTRNLRTSPHEIVTPFRYNRGVQLEKFGNPPGGGRKNEEESR
jgi:hypothetical protein